MNSLKHTPTKVLTPSQTLPLQVDVIQPSCVNRGWNFNYDITTQLLVPPFVAFVLWLLFMAHWAFYLLANRLRTLKLSPVVGFLLWFMPTHSKNVWGVLNHILAHSKFQQG